MKVLFLPKWYPNLNDVQHGIFIKNQALAIARHTSVGVVFAVTSEMVKEEKIEIEKKSNYISVTCYFPKRSNRLFALFNYYKAFSKAREKLEQEWGRPDVINLYILGRNYMMYKKFYAGIPLVVSEQWSGYLNGGMEKYIYAKRRNTLNALRKANEIIAVSEPLANALKKYSGREMINIIPNIVYSSGITSNVPGEIIRILTVADLDDSIKNISGMMDVLSVVSQNHKIHFTVVGEGRDEEFLRKRANSLETELLQISFLQRMPHPDLLQEYEKSNFYFLNSHVETFCVAAAESIAAGRPVISTRCGGPEEYLNKDNSLFFEGNSVDEKARKVIQMIEKMNEKSFNPDRVAATINEKYSPDAVAKQYLSVFNKAINKKKT